jgi:hypothetical protein
VTRATRSGLVALAVALGVAACFTRPFSRPSEVLVSLGIVGCVATLVLQGRSSAPPLIARRPPMPGQPVPGGTRQATPPARRLVPWTPWAVVGVAWVGWELFCYAGAPRRAHPTLSVVLNAVDASHVGHAAAFAAWLALGWYLVTR